jgi:hypothetical protein
MSHEFQKKQVTKHSDQDSQQNNPEWNQIQPSTNNGGQTLEPQVRAELEPKFGHSFENIRVFSDEQAAQLAEQHDANAFTTGSNIYFAREAYQPRTSEGLGLITHEVTHALQNQQFGASDNNRPSQAGDAAEIEASSNTSSVLAGGTASISSTPSAAVARQDHGRDHRRDAAHDSETTGSHPEPEAPATHEDELRIIGHEGDNLVLNRVAFRDEAIRYIWGDRFTPTIAEFSGVGDVVTDPEAGELSLGSDRWTLARTGLAARPELYSAMRPEVRPLVEHSPDLTEGRPPDRPEWIPESIWQQFMATTGDGMHRYKDTSELETDIILVRLNGRISGYAEVQEHEEILYRQMHIEPPSTRLLGLSTEQNEVHLTAIANAGFNNYMWREVSAGIDPITARSNYPERVRTRYLLAFVDVVGFMGSMAPSYGTVPGVGAALDGY